MVMEWGHEFACFFCWCREVARRGSKMYVMAASGRIHHYKQKLHDIYIMYLDWAKYTDLSDMTRVVGLLASTPPFQVWGYLNL
jgi:hypothetical protein